MTTQNVTTQLAACPKQKFALVGFSGGAPVIDHVLGAEGYVGGGKSLIPFSSDKRAATGLSGGDAITVELTLDTAPRTVELPTDLVEALDAAGARAAFDALSPSARKAHVTNVETAKTDETRHRRIDTIAAKLAG